MTCQIDTILYDIGSDAIDLDVDILEKRRPHRGWFAGKTLVDYGIAPELAGKIAECYHKGIGVAVDPYEALRYVCIYYRNRHRIHDEKLQIPNETVIKIAQAGQRTPRLSRVLNLIEGYNDLFSWTSAIPDVVEAATESISDVISLCSRLGIASMVGYSVQFTATISMVIRDLWLQRKNFATQGFFHTLLYTLLKDDRWSRLCDSTLWVFLPIAMITVGVPHLEMVIFILGSAINFVTVFLGDLRVCLLALKEIAIVKQLLKEVRDEIQERAETASPLELQVLEDRASELQAQIRDMQKAIPKFFIESLFSAVTMAAYVVGSVLLFYNPIAGCAVMAAALFIDFVVGRALAIRDAKAAKFTVPKDLKHDFRLFGRRRGRTEQLTNNDDYDLLEDINDDRPLLLGN